MEGRAGQARLSVSLQLNTPLLAAGFFICPFDFWQATIMAPVIPKVQPTPLPMGQKV
jgi:hypothetical protein